MTTPTPPDDPVFTRGDLAKILNVTALTIANREKAHKYPQPRRDINNYRVYGLNDVFTLQVTTYGGVDPLPIISLLYDKGYRDMKQLGKIVNTALTRRTGTV